MAKPTDLPPKEAYEHGTRARYVAGCKCDKCRKANVAVYHDRQQRSKEAALDREILPPVAITRTWEGPKGEIKTRTYENGCPGVNSKPCSTESTIRKDSTGGICGGCRGKLVWNGLVPTKPARLHLAWLSRNGVGRRASAAASDVANTVLADITSKKKKKIRNSTEKAILDVDLSCASDGAWTPSKKSWDLISKMRKLGMTRTEIARKLGSKAKVPALQIGEEMVLVSTAHKIKKLWDSINSKEGVELDGPLAPIDICTQCGHSHKPANRQKLIKRMVLEGLQAREIKEAWPCFYPHTGINDAADRRLFRDIGIIKKKEEK